MPERISGTLYRMGSARAEDVNAEERTIDLSFSSEAPVVRDSFFDDAWVETLGHKDSEVDLSRLNAGAPLLWGHSRNGTPIGVVERAWLEDGRGRATVRFSKRADVDDIVLDVSDGILRNVSVGYQIGERTLTAEHDDQPNDYRVTNWTPMEISLVDIPADANVGVGRAYFPNPDGEHYRVISTPENEVIEMPENTEVRADDTPVEQNTVDAEAIRAEAVAATRAAEAERVRQLGITFNSFREQYPDLYDECRNDPSCSIEVARERLLVKLGEGVTPVTGGSRVDIVDDGRDRFLRGAVASTMARAAVGEHDPQSEFRSFTLYDLARYSLERNGVATGRLERMDLIGRAITHSSGDFTALLANVANKAMMTGFQEAQTTYGRWCSIGSASDFRAFDRVTMTAFPTLPTVAEGAEYTYGTVADSKETAVLLKHGRIFSITREAIINDDLNELIRTPQRLGASANRTVDKLPYDVLNANADMRDGAALFVAGHSNLAGSGAAPDAATVDAGRTAMATQVNGDATSLINVMPAFALVPYALFGTMSTVIESETKVLSGQANSRVANPVRNAVRDIIASAWLDASSTTAWYLAADPGQHDTVEVAFLNGNQTPTLEQQAGWEVDGTEFKVRIDAVAKALDWRGLYKNAGA